MFAFCIESSHARGMGHLYRALNLADELRKAGFSCRFYLNNHARSHEILRARSFESTTVDLADLKSGWESDIVRRDRIQVWINDRLDTDEKHTSRIKGMGLPLVTFDDRGKGARLADLHIAGLAFDERESLSGNCVLRGLEYLILNPAIAEYARLRKSPLNSILVTMGGSDTYGVTVKAVKMLSEMGLVATVILGPAFQHEKELQKILTPGFILKRVVPSLIEEFVLHDLAITGGGITPFEANASGLPCIVIANEVFEIPVGEALAGIGSSVFAGYHPDIGFSDFKMDLPVEEMSSTGIAMITLDGCRNVAGKLSELVTD